MSTRTNVGNKVPQWPPLYLVCFSEKIISIRVFQVKVLRSTEPQTRELGNKKFHNV
jgi:hypothetical protein